MTALPVAGRGRERHRAREAALQMLYQWEIAGGTLDDLMAAFWATHEPEAPERLRTFAESLVRGAVGRLREIDPLIAASADNWRLSRMAVLDKLIMRLAVYEFLNEGSTPRKVAINEALELARTFSTDEAVKFINGVLDDIRRRLEEAARG